jgi:hypothetical protein
MTSTEARQLIAEMKLNTSHENNGVLIDSFRILVVSGAQTDEARLCKSIITDELARRNADLAKALDAWADDLESEETHEAVVLRHLRGMRRDCRFHNTARK